MRRIFVYGTLKKGFPNHSLLQDEQNGKAIFLSNGTTSEKYPLVVDPDYGIPFALDSPGNGKNIEGEIWEVDDPMLKKLDELEIHPEWYKRFEFDISVLESVEDGKQAFSCWMYLLTDFDPKMASYEHMSSYSGSRYIRPSARLPNFDPWSFKKS